MTNNEFKNKYQLTREENIRFAKQNLTRLIFISSRFEGLTTTLPQTQTIVDGLGVDGVSIDDINTIVQLKRGWQFMLRQKPGLTLEMEKKINSIVARDDAAYPGYIRNGNGLVSTYRGDFKPPMVSEQNETNFLSELSKEKSSITNKAMTLMYHNMRQQMFYDGNKRTAIIAANKLMIDHGAGLLAVPVDQWPTWQQKIADFYFSNNMQDLKEWTYNNGIQGMKPNLAARKELGKHQKSSLSDKNKTREAYLELLRQKQERDRE